VEYPLTIGWFYVSTPGKTESPETGPFCYGPQKPHSGKMCRLNRVATDVKVYFCDPQSPWQRGSNENANGLLHQYLPKKADLSGYSQSELDQIALRLNRRPRKTLGFATPE